MATYYRSRHPLISFRQSKVHGTGGFAKLDIRRGKRIVEYLGPRLSQAEAQARLDQGNAFIFNLDDETAIDGWVPWNTARFLNHSCTPVASALLRSSRPRWANGFCIGGKDGQRKSGTHLKNKSVPFLSPGPPTTYKTSQDN